jgi:HEAT repeat protein
MGPDAKAAAPALADCVLTASETQLRIHCAMILGRLGPDAKDALPSLIKAAAQDRDVDGSLYGDRPTTVREAAILAALRIDPSARKKMADAVLPSLMAMITSENDVRSLLERQSAMRVLAMLGPDATAALPKLQNPNVQYLAEVDLYVAACVSFGKDGEKCVTSLFTNPASGQDHRIAILRALATHPGLGRESIDALISLLADPDDTIRCHAAWALSAQGPAAEPAIPALAKRLGDSAFDSVPRLEGISHFVAEALARIGPKAIPALKEALKDKERRDRALIALARMGPSAKPVVPALRELLAGAPSLTSVRAAIALLEIGEAPKAPVRVLVAALDTDHCGEAVEYLSYGTEQDLLRRIIEDPAADLAIPVDAVPALLKLLDGDSHSWAAVATMSRMPHAADVIIPALSKRIRTAGAFDFLALLKIYSCFGPAAKAGVPDIIWCIKNDRPGSCVAFKQAAIESLGAIGPEAKDAVPMLLAIATDPEHFAASHAMSALGDIGVVSPELIDLLVTVLHDPNDGTPGRRHRQRTAASALMKLGPAAKPALLALREALFSDDALVRLYATAALIRAGDRGASIERLLDTWRDMHDPAHAQPVLPEWLEVIELLGPRAAKAVPRLITLLADPAFVYDSDYRTEAARVLGKIGPDAKAALPRLRELAAQPGRTSRPATLAIQAITRDAKP